MKRSSLVSQGCDKILLGFLVCIRAGLYTIVYHFLNIEFWIWNFEFEFVFQEACTVRHREDSIFWKDVTPAGRTEAVICRALVMNDAWTRQVRQNSTSLRPWQHRASPRVTCSAHIDLYLYNPHQASAAYQFTIINTRIRQNKPYMH